MIRGDKVFAGTGTHRPGHPDHLVRSDLGGTNDDVAFLFAAYGLGSMTVAILLSRVLERVPARTVMVAGAAAMAGLLGTASVGPGWTGALVLWALLGAASSAIGTPGGLLLRRSSHRDSRPAVFAAQFALSHACWLVTYPAAGWLGTTIGIGPTFIVMAVGAAAGVVVALALWPAEDLVEVEHVHRAFEHDAPHVHDDHHRHKHEGWEGPEPHRHPHRHQPIRHRHALVIDDHHATWPTGTAGG
ncbi:hypothetical protein Sa4125_21370 [Aureimonas sp. SA4125]|nr:hypothetical protein Sa4125_21370 [Aureimonas sp. SA4125]